MTLAALVFRRAVDDLRASGSPDPEADAWILLSRATGRPRSSLLLREPLDEETEAAFLSMAERRKSGEPAQYIARSTAFYGLDLYVDERVLIPRQDTETLAEAAIGWLRARPGAFALDLCCGSGALAVAAGRFSGAQMHASDISPGALEVARRNADAHGVPIALHLGDGFSPLGGLRFDAILCNPPYIPTGRLAGLQPEVRREPRLALDGGPDGLLYRRLALEAPAFLREDGLLLEVGHDQMPAVAGLFSAAGFRDATSISDLNGVGRVLRARPPAR